MVAGDWPGNWAGVDICTFWHHEYLVADYGDLGCWQKAGDSKQTGVGLGLARRVSFWGTITGDLGFLLTYRDGICVRISIPGFDIYF